MAKPAELIHAMAERSMKKLRIAMFLPGGIYSYLSASSRIKKEDGGPEVENPLLVGGNPNVGPATYYDKVPVARTSELNTVKYEMTRVVGTYVISEQEVDENMGAAKIVDIASAKMKALEISFKRYQREKAATTTTGKDPQGLPNLLPTANSTGTIGGINLASEPLWRHNVYLFSGALTSGNIEQNVDDILLDTQMDEGKITVFFAGRKMYNLCRDAVRDRATIQFGAGGFTKKLVNIGIVGTTIQGISVIYDEELDPDVMYGVNENEIMIHILKSANMKLKDLTAPYDQDVIGKRYINEYQLASWKQYRTHCLISNKV